MMKKKLLASLLAAGLCAGLSFFAVPAAAGSSQTVPPAAAGSPGFTQSLSEQDQQIINKVVDNFK